MITQYHYNNHDHDFNYDHRQAERSMTSYPVYERPAYYGPYTERPALPPDGNFLAQRSELQRQDNKNERRRSPVACARCRKRKIKCSGDPGDGSGCNACKTSGADLSQCTFDRVNSQVCQLKTLDYFGSQLYSNPQMGVDTPGALPGTSQNMGYGSFSPTNGQVSSAYYNRSAYPSTTIAQYAQDPRADVYNTPVTTALSMQTQVQDVPLSGYSYPSHTRPSNVVAQRTLSVPTKLYSQEQPVLGGYSSGQTPYQDSVSHRFSASVTEGLSPLNMTSLHLSLPSQSERRLPVPTGAPSNPLGAPSSADSFDIRGLPSLQLSTAVSKDGMTQSHDTLPPTGKMLDLATVSATLPPMSRRSDSSSPVSTPADTGVLGYIFPSPNTPDISPDVKNSAYSGAPLPAVTTTVMPASMRYQSSSLPTTAAEDNPAMRHNSTSRYGWSTSRHSSVLEGSGEDTLTNGQRYIPLHQPQPQPQHVPSFEAIRRETFQQQQQQQQQAWQVAHRDSVQARSF